MSGIRFIAEPINSESQDAVEKANLFDASIRFANMPAAFVFKPRCELIFIIKAFENIPLYSNHQPTIELEETTWIRHTSDEFHINKGRCVALFPNGARISSAIHTSLEVSAKIVSDAQFFRESQVRIAPRFPSKYVFFVSMAAYSLNRSF